MVVYLKKDKLEEILARKNLSFNDLAKILGVSRQYIYLLKEPEKYNLSPSPELREKMLRILEVEFDDIFFIQNIRFNGQKNQSNPDGQKSQENQN